MIDLVVGVPGSGKTYFAVNKVLDLISSKEKVYKHIYTNINGLNYNKCNKIAKIDDYVKSFDFNNLKKQINDEFTTYQQVQNGYLNVSDYDEFVKSQHILESFYDSLIIVDECHLYFTDKADEALIRFLSYHRHFNIDLLLLTQNKNLVNKKYLSFIESMYQALPGSKRFFSNVFRYKVFASYQEYKSNLIKTTSLKLRSNVFELYNSGSNKLTKSVMLRFLFPVLFLAFLVFLYYNFFVKEHFDKSSVSSHSKVIVSNLDNNVSTPSRSKILNDVSYIHNPDKKFYMISCFKDNCSFQFDSFNFDRASMFKIFDRFKCKVIINRTFTTSYHTYVVDCFSDLDKFLNITKRSVNNEKSVNTDMPVTKSIL